MQCICPHPLPLHYPYASKSKVENPEWSQRQMMVVGSRHSWNDSTFYLCTLFQGKTEGVRDLQSDTSVYLLERVSPLSKGLRAACFFLSFFVIIRHCAPPSSLKTIHILPGESSNITTLLHRYSSLGSLTFSHPISFPSPPLSSSVLSLHLVSSSVSESVALLFMYFPLPTALDLLPPLPHYLYFGGAECTPSHPPSLSPSICICKCLFWSCGPQQIFNINEDPHECLSSN